MRTNAGSGTSAFAMLLALPLTAYADTGPEYLEGAARQDPLEAAFKQLRLPFAEDHHSEVHLRSFFMDRDADNVTDASDWAAGGWLNLVTDFWQDRVKLAATGYTSQKVWSDNNEVSTGALQPDGDSYSVLGEIYGTLSIDGVALQAGRYLVNLPYINASDIRMTPNTFEGAQAVFSLSDQWSFGGGVLTDIKRRTSTDFVPLYESARLEGDEDITILTSIYETSPGNSAGVYFLDAPDFMRGAYLEANRSFSIGEGRSLQFSGQYTHQEPDGEELAGDIDARHYGLRATWQYNWYSGSLAWTDYPEDKPILSPWGGIPGYTSVMIKDFNRPKETTWLLGGTADLSGLGFPGMTINAKYVVGDTPDCGVNATPDQNELDLNLVYSPLQGFLKGLDMRLRFGFVDQDASCDVQRANDVADIRFILNYNFGL